MFVRSIRDSDGDMILARRGIRNREEIMVAE